MTAHWLEEALATCGLPTPSTFPRDLAAEAPMKLRVRLVSLPHLTSDTVRDWLAHRGLHHRVAATCRPLHGCMVARGGGAFLFHDSLDSKAEQRFTLAHELAHFVLDHLVPRADALRTFGERIRPVLDGVRRPTPEESLSFALDGIVFGFQVKLMDRSPTNAPCTGKVAESERRADRLAYELLAPAALVRPMLRDGTEAEAEALLTSHFGLPEPEARKYARTLRRRERPPRFSIVEFLGEEVR